MKLQSSCHGRTRWSCAWGGYRLLPQLSRSCSSSRHHAQWRMVQRVYYLYAFLMAGPLGTPLSCSPVRSTQKTHWKSTRKSWARGTLSCSRARQQRCNRCVEIFILSMIYGGQATWLDEFFYYQAAKQYLLKWVLLLFMNRIIK